MCSNHPGINLQPALGTQDKTEHLSSYTHVVHTTAKQVISRLKKNENVFKMSKDEKCTCKACKNAVFHCQICKIVGFLLPSSSWLLKLPIVIGLSFCRSRFKLYVIKVRRIDRWKRQEAKHNQILLIRPDLLETWLELTSVNYHSSILVSSNWPQVSERLKN